MKKPSIENIVLEIINTCGMPLIETDLARMIPLAYPGRIALPSTISRKCRGLVEKGEIASQYRKDKRTGEELNYKEYYKANTIASAPAPQAPAAAAIPASDPVQIRCGTCHKYSAQMGRCRQNGRPVGENDIEECWELF